MSLEQRANTRFDVRWKARILLPDKSIFKIVLRNISRGGVSLIFHQALVSKSAVHLEFHVPYLGELYRIRTKCIVAHQTILSNNQGAKIGLMFVDMNNQDSHSLSNALQELSDRAG